jgi:UTP-glucose-1-phosphate uridylyltransferase
MSRQLPTLVVMAAGAGSRFGGPKQTAPVGPNGEWLPEYAVFDARRAGFGRVVFITRPELQPEFDRLTSRLDGPMTTEIVHQRLDDIPPGTGVVTRDKPWGTGHAVLSVRNVVTTPFAIMNADDFYGAEAYRLGAAACARAASSEMATVVAMRLDATLSPHGPVKRGWCQTSGDRVTRLEEIMGISRRDRQIVAEGRHAGLTFTGRELVSMNYWVFPPAVFSLLYEEFRSFLRRFGTDPEAEFLLPDVINGLIAQGRLELRAVEAPGPWFGLTYQEDLPEVQAGLRRLTDEGVYPSPLWPDEPPR